MGERNGGPLNGASATSRIAWEVGLSPQTGDRLSDPSRLWRVLKRFADDIVGPEAEVDVHLLPCSTEVLSHPYLNMLNGVQIVENVMAREREGYAAAMVAPAIDPALTEARSAVSMPVTGSLESALVASQFVGRNVGVIAVNSGYATAIADDVRRYGLADRLIGVRPIRRMELSYPDIERALDGDGATLADNIAAVAGGLIDDGADVIINACQFYGAALWAAGVTQFLPDGVAVIDCAAAGLAMARALVSLRRTMGIEKSGGIHSPFRGVDAEILWAAQARLGAAPRPTVPSGG